jgi:hypothetical protein
MVEIIRKGRILLQFRGLLVLTANRQGVST